PTSACRRPPPGSRRSDRAVPSAGCAPGGSPSAPSGRGRARDRTRRRDPPARPVLRSSASRSTASRRSWLGLLIVTAADATGDGAGIPGGRGSVYGHEVLHRRCAGAESELRSWERSETCLGRLVDVGAPGSTRPAGPDATTAPAFPPTERGTRAPTPGLVVPPAPPSRRAAVARGASRRGRGRG